MPVETQKAIIRISGMQFAPDIEEEDGVVENMMPGSCKKIGDMYYIRYEELQEGFTQKSDVLIKAKPGYLEMTKKGLINVHMVISSGETHQTNYTTPFGNLLFSIRGKNIAVYEAEEGIKVHAKYDMDVNYEYLSENDIRIEASYCK